MEESKKWYMSKGIWGALMAGVAGAWGVFESIHAFVDAHPDMEKGVGGIIDGMAHDPSGLVVIVGAFFAWYGRYKASSKISDDIF